MINLIRITSTLYFVLDESDKGLLMLMAICFVHYFIYIIVSLSIVGWFEVFKIQRRSSRHAA
jgi:hypothetical protein